MTKNQVVWRVVLVVSLVGILGWFSGSRAATTTVTPSVSINSGASQTTVRAVTLKLVGPKKVVSMKISNLSDLSDASWKPFDTEVDWKVSYGSGTKTVYVKFKDKSGTISETYKDTISLYAPSALAVTVDINDKKTETTSRYVFLKFTYSSGAEEVQLSNDSTFETYETYPIDPKISWVLSPGAGTKTVYARVTDVNGKTITVTDTIIYNQPKDYIPEGTVVKSPQDSLYYFGFDGRLHPFGNLAVFHSWYEDFTGVKAVSKALISKYQIGAPVCVRPGSWLVQFESFGRYYAVEPGCTLRTIRSDAEAFILYGATWKERVVQLPVSLQSNYVVISQKAKSGTDKDGDGVDKETEKLYGTSDSAYDSDHDAVSDYEEIYFWLSDPTNNDTDGDGYLDGQEIAAGFSPNGVGTVKEIAEGTYQYPAGSFTYSTADKKVYYTSAAKKVYAVGGSSVAKTAEAYEFPGMFVALTPYQIDLGPIEKKTFTKTSDEILLPTVKKQKQLLPM